MRKPCYARLASRREPHKRVMLQSQTGDESDALLPSVLDKPITKFKGKGDNVVAKGHPKYQDGVVLVNPSQGFEGIPEDVLEFHIGGYQVCSKWLKDRRGRELSAEDITHYQKIVVALKETNRLMKEIDEVIEVHGGWPIG